MSNGTLALSLALALGPWAAACDGGGVDEEVCPGTSDELVGACHEADGTCKEYRGAIDELEARDDCAGGDAPVFRATACPAAARLRGSCSGPPGWSADGAGTVVAFEPRAVGYEFKLDCVELGGCYDPSGRDDDACYGTTDVLVGSCLHESGRCMEYRGAIDDAEARDQCAGDPAGEFHEAPCPASTRVSGSCSAAAHGGTVALFHQVLTPDELRELCGEEHACYEPP